MKPGILSFITSLLIGAVASSALAQDRCEFFSDLDQQGARVSYNLPDANLATQPWSNLSRRFEGANLKVHAPAIYRNLESVRITARDSGVTLYVYDGDNFDGNFQAVRIDRGTVGTWNFGSMKNKVRSIICQRDERLPASTDIFAAITGLQDNHMIPTSILANALTAAVHDAVRTQRGRFYDGKIDIVQGRLSWATGHELCRSVSCVSIPDAWRRKYWDFLRFSYKGRGRLKADGKNYTMSIDIWIEPFLDNGNLRFRVDATKVDVSDWIWHRLIRDKLRAEVDRVRPTIGPQLELGLRTAVRDALGEDGVDLLGGNDRLVFSYACNSVLDRVGYPNYNYSSFQVANICGGTTPESVVSPGLRLLRE